MMERLMLDTHKLAWHSERVKAWLAGERIAPITIDCSLSKNCNYRCQFCFGQFQKNPGKPLTKKVIFDFLDDCAEIGVKAVSFVSDGESTCNPYYADAVVHAKQTGLDVALGTNGSLLDTDRLYELIECLTYLRFNFSAANRINYAKIHGCRQSYFDKVCGIIKLCSYIKQQTQSKCTIGLQMVLLPEYIDQVVPLALLGKSLGVDYTVIKHCSDLHGGIGIDYSKYLELTDIFKQAESLSEDNYQVHIKWSKLMSGGKREYKQCYGCIFLLQMSGSGLVAPCGSFFRPSSKYHIGNISDTRFRDIFKSERYWQVMDMLAFDGFDARTDCATLCLQEKVNEYLYAVKNSAPILEYPESEMPLGGNFI